jgi:DMSO/TMAO reductase YedYZ molybdopterin-dependent catalytic subunit
MFNDIDHLIRRREFVGRLLPGSVLVVLGGSYVLLGDSTDAQARQQRRADGRPRLPPGQRVVSRLKPMGGREGNPSKNAYSLRVHGLVERPETLDIRALLAMEQTEQQLDVHCVTGWSVLGANWRGLSVASLAERVGVKKGARHVIFEAAHGYTANVPLGDALRPEVMLAHRLDDRPLSRENGAPVRALVPDLYFWKSAKWLTGIRFVARDIPGYWEQRGYHNHGDPWREQRYG